MSDSVKKFIEHNVRSDVRDMSAYHVQDASGMVKLDAMESPFAWPGQLAGWPEVMAEVEVNRYPDPSAAALTEALRKAMAIPAPYQLVLGNGSDELIQLLIQLIACPGARVVAPEPSFVMYRVLAEANRVDYHGVALDKEFQLDMPAMLDAVNSTSPSVLFLACPNNPTGIRYREQDIRQLAEASTGLVVVDEAYIAFSQADALPLLEDYPNLVVMRTLSKMGLAGLRLGVLIGRPEWLGEVDKLRLPYNINTLTQVAARFALAHYSQLEEQAVKLCEQRGALEAALRGMLKNGDKAFARVWPSEANFVLVRTRPGEARPIFESLKRQGVLIKCLDGGHPALTDCLRLTVGSEEENHRLLTALEASQV